MGRYSHWAGQIGARAGLLALLVVLPLEAASAQSSVVARVDKLEKEMQAVQRKVFPGGTGRFFEPEIAPPAGASTAASAGGGSSITPEMLARIDSLESALQRMTGRIEEQELMLSDMRRRLDAIDGGAVSRTTASASAATPRPAPPPAAAAAAAQNGSPDPQRLQGVAAVEKPSTDDAGDDAYSYGFRLWDAGYYPEARIALQKYIDDYPGHWRQSHARNLLGRAWLDDNKPASSVEIFLSNYQSDPKGARAPDSLLYLGQAMVKLDKREKACLVLDELGDVYPDVATGRLSGEIATTRGKAGCN